MDKLTLSFAGHSVDWASLPDNSKIALATLGFSTKIKNSIAGVRKGIMGEGANPWSDDDLKAEAEKIGLAEFGRNDATADAICANMQKEMFDAIVAGISHAERGGGKPRLTDDEKLRQTIAVELFTGAAKAQGKTLPKRSKPDEKAAFEALLAKAFERPAFAAAVEKEFKRRKGAKAADGLDDLFA
jgi:hypothetical protein